MRLKKVTYEFTFLNGEYCFLPNISITKLDAGVSRIIWSFYLYVREEIVHFGRTCPLVVGMGSISSAFYSNYSHRSQKRKKILTT